MSNFKNDIMAAIEHKEDDYYISALYIEEPESHDNLPDIPNTFLGRLIAVRPDVNEALDHLNYEYDSGFGCRECHCIWLWTGRFVYTIHEYDGSTYIQVTPRHPAMIHYEKAEERDYFECRLTQEEYNDLMLARKRDADVARFVRHGGADNAKV